jgi:hypothetical protein
MRIPGSAQHEIFLFQDIDEAGIARNNGGGNFHHAIQNLVQRIGRRHAAPDLVQHVHVQMHD